MEPRCVLLRTDYVPTTQHVLHDNRSGCERFPLPGTPLLCLILQILLVSVWVLFVSITDYGAHLLCDPAS